MRSIWLALASLLFLPACVNEPVACIALAEGEELEAGVPFKPGNCSTDADEFEWDFGDGSTTNVADPEYIYSDTGTFTIRLVASNHQKARHSTEEMEIDVLAPNLKFAGSFYDSNQQNLVDLEPGHSIWSLGLTLNGQYFCTAVCTGNALEFDQQYLSSAEYTELFYGDGFIFNDSLIFGLRVKQVSGLESYFEFKGKRVYP